MAKIILVVLGLISVAAAMALAMRNRQTTPLDTKPHNLHDYTVVDIKGNKKSLKDYEGKVVMVVNVASKCGLTPQYEQLEALYEKYKDQGLVILGFPCNQFMGQEPGTEEEILTFCTNKYNVTFPMFSKVEVKGENAHPLYKWLVGATENKADIEWNFAKFIVSRDGAKVQRFASKTKPDDASVVSVIEKALAE